MSESAKVECVGICHKGPIDDSQKSIRYAADHDPDSFAAYLFTCNRCGRQLALCEKKVDSLMAATLLGTGYMKCNECKDRVPLTETSFVRLS